MKNKETVFEKIFSTWVQEKNYERDEPLIEKEIDDKINELMEKDPAFIASLENSPKAFVAPLFHRPWFRVAFSLAASILVCVSVTLTAIKFFGPTLIPTELESKGNEETEKSAWEDISGLKSGGEVMKRIAGAFPTGWRRAGLVVGVSRYKSDKIRPLSSANDEAKSAGTMMVENLGFDKKGVICLLDDLATEAAVRASLTHLRQFNQSEDLIMIYFSSHGVIGVNGHAKFQMYDSKPAGGITAREIFQLLGSPWGNVLLVLDACYAADVKKKNFGKENFWMVAATSPGEPAFSVPTEKRSLFGSFWFKALRGHADENGDYIVTLNEAFNWVKSKMEREKYEQTPVLFGSGNPDEIILSIHDELWSDLAQGGSSPESPVPLRLNLGNPDAQEIIVDGVSLGKFSEKTMVLPMTPGKHSVIVKNKTAWGEVKNGDEWRGEIHARASVPLERTVFLSPTIMNRLKVVSPDDSGLFSRLVRNPDDDSIDSSWQSDGTLKFTFRWSGHHKDSQQVLSAAYISDGLRGINAPKLFGVEDESMVKLKFDARAEKDRIKATFYFGGIGADSLKAAVEKNIVLNGITWKHIQIVAPSSQLHNLVTGFGVKVDARENNYKKMIIWVRDVTLTPVAEPQ